MLLALWIEQVAAVEGSFSADRDVVGILDVNEGQRPNAVGGKVGVDRAAAGIVAVEVGTGVERLVGFEILNAFERGSFFQAQRHVALKENASTGECAGRDDYRPASALPALLVLPSATAPKVRMDTMMDNNRFMNLVFGFRSKLRKNAGITSKNGRNDAKRLNINVVTVTNDDKMKKRKTQ